MTGRIGLQGMIKGNSRIRAVAIGMVKVVLVVFILMAASLGRASAAGNDSPKNGTDVPNCGSEPICGYIQAHSLDKLVIAAPDCGRQPICGYLKAHNLPNSAANAPLSAILLAQSQLAAYDAQLRVAKSTLVRSGPGGNFFSYGELPAAYVSQVIGVNQQGDWLAIPLPLSAAPDGMGWVEAASVNTSNVAKAQIDPPACGELAYCGYLIAHNEADQQPSEMDCGDQPICGYLRAHMRQNLPVLHPSYIAEGLLGLPIILATGQ